VHTVHIYIFERALFKLFIIILLDIRVHKEH